MTKSVPRLKGGVRVRKGACRVMDAFDSTALYIYQVGKVWRGTTLGALGSESSSLVETTKRFAGQHSSPYVVFRDEQSEAAFLADSNPESQTLQNYVSVMQLLNAGFVSTIHELEEQARAHFTSFDPAAHGAHRGEKFFRSIVRIPETSAPRINIFNQNAITRAHWCFNEIVRGQNALFGLMQAIEWERNLIRAFHREPGHGLVFKKMTLPFGSRTTDFSVPRGSTGRVLLVPRDRSVPSVVGQVERSQHFSTGRMMKLPPGLYAGQVVDIAPVWWRFDRRCECNNTIVDVAHRVTPMDVLSGGAFNL